MIYFVFGDGGLFLLTLLLIENPSVGPAIPASDASACSVFPIYRRKVVVKLLRAYLPILDTPVGPVKQEMLLHLVESRKRRRRIPGFFQAFFILLLKLLIEASGLSHAHDTSVRMYVFINVFSI